MATRRAERCRHTADVRERSGPRIGVRKTYKLYIGGAFPRSESGRSYPVRQHDGSPPTPSARRARTCDAVRAAHGVPRLVGQDGDEPGSGAVSGRRADGGSPRPVRRRGRRGGGLRDGRASRSVDRAIDRWVWYAGWADKITQILQVREPGGRTVLQFHDPRADRHRRDRRAQASALLGLVSRLAPPLVAGNTVVLLASETRPLPAITLTEVLATSDVPGGVVNVLTGFKAELVPVLAGHVDVDGLDVRVCPTTFASRPSSWPPTTSSACRAARAGSPMPASTGWTTAPPNAPNGSPPSSR